MGVVVAFDYDAWVARYPEFSAVNEATATAYFNEATIYHSNDGSGPVPTAAIQSTLLNMLTAHIAARYAPGPGGAPASGIVGRITNASEGSVSVQAEYADETPGTMAWYVQTKYGADYWNATLPFRTMRYRPSAQAAFGRFAVPFGGRYPFNR